MEPDLGKREREEEEDNDDDDDEEEDVSVPTQQPAVKVAKSSSEASYQHFQLEGAGYEGWDEGVWVVCST